MADDLQTFLARERALIDDTLDQRLPPADTRPTRLHQAMRYSVLAGGKRLRPILCRAAAAAVGAAPDQALGPALAIEVLHTYTLIHDDLPCMDDDDLRRGQPTCHKRFDEATAVLAGDALLTLAFEWLARAGEPDLLTELARAAGSTGVIGGQVEDLAAESRTPDAGTLDYIHRHKTAALIRAAVVIGARVATQRPATIDALAAYGEALGLAFQIVDDILDVTSDTASLGKPVGSDEANGKMTYVALHGIDGAKRRVRELTDTAGAALAIDGIAPDRLRQIAAALAERTT